MKDVDKFKNVFCYGGKCCGGRLVVAGWPALCRATGGACPVQRCVGWAGWYLQLPHGCPAPHLLRRVHPRLL